MASVKTQDNIGEGHLTLASARGRNLRVFVISSRGEPLMPTYSSKARKLLEQGKAKVVHRTPFTIQLTGSSGGNTQPISLGVDAGTKHIGLSATTPETVLYEVATFSHEVVHVRQWRDDTAGFMLRYLCSKNARAEYEAEAYGADLELSHWLDDPLDPNELAGRLASYGLASEYIAFAAAYLATYDDILRQGGSVSPAAKWTIAWLEAKGVTP